MSGNHDHSRKFLETLIMSREDHKKSDGTLMWMTARNVHEKHRSNEFVSKAVKTFHVS